MASGLPESNFGAFLDVSKTSRAEGSDAAGLKCSNGSFGSKVSLFEALLALEERAQDEVGNSRCSQRKQAGAAGIEMGPKWTHQIFLTMHQKRIDEARHAGSRAQKNAEQSLPIDSRGGIEFLTDTSA